MHDRLVAPTRASSKAADLQAATPRRSASMPPRSARRSTRTDASRRRSRATSLEARRSASRGRLTLYINGRRGNGVPPAGGARHPDQEHARRRRRQRTGARLTPTTLDLGGAPIRGVGDRAGHHRRVLRLPVRLLLPRATRPLTQLLEPLRRARSALVFKHSPIEGHNDAPLAHRAALAAQQQGKFWEMHDRIFANQRAMERDGLLAHAKALGLDVAKFTADLDSPAFAGRVRPRSGQEGAKRSASTARRRSTSTARRWSAPSRLDDLLRRHRQGRSRRRARGRCAPRGARAARVRRATAADHGDTIPAMQRTWPVTAILSCSCSRGAGGRRRPSGCRRSSATTWCCSSRCR